MELVLERIPLLHFPELLKKFLIKFSLVNIRFNLGRQQTVGKKVLEGHA